MKKILRFLFVTLLLLIASTQGVFAQWYEITEEKYDASGKMLYCIYNYKSIDEKGEEIILSSYLQCGSSGIVMDGTSTDQLHQIVLLHHYTIYDNSKCPTQQKYNLLDAGTLLDKLVIVPDYQGFGVSKDRLQMYMIHELCGRQNFDALVAGKKIFDDMSNLSLKEDWTLALAGASQGASNTIATHRYMTHNNLCDSWRLSASVVCDGPYCPAKMLEALFDQEKYGKLYLPMAMVIAVKAMMTAYPDVFVGYEEKDFYTEEFAALMPQIDAAVAARDASLDALEDSLTNKKAVPYDIHKMFCADLFDKDSAKRIVMMKALDKCDVTTGWIASQPILGWDYPEDDVVPHVNSEILKDAFGDMVTLDDPSAGINIAHALLQMATLHQTACGGFLAAASILALVGINVKGMDDYIKASATGIDNIYFYQPDMIRYDLYGRQVDQNHRGFIIVGGKLQLAQ